MFSPVTRPPRLQLSTVSSSIVFPTPSLLLLRVLHTVISHDIIACRNGPCLHQTRFRTKHHSSYVRFVLAVGVVVAMPTLEYNPTKPGGAMYVWQTTSEPNTQTEDICFFQLQNTLCNISADAAKLLLDSVPRHTTCSSIRASRCFLAPGFQHEKDFCQKTFVMFTLIIYLLQPSNH